MIIIGAKGFAKEVLEVLHQLHVDAADICFFDDISTKKTGNKIMVTAWNFSFYYSFC